MSFPITIVAAALLELGEPAQGRSCPVATAPARLPDVSAIVDVEALRIALTPVLAGAPTAGDMLFSVRFKKNGQNEWVQAIGDDADEGIRPAVARLVAAHLRSSGASPEAWSFRLAVIPAETVQFQVNRSEVCPVEIEPGQPAFDRRLTFTTRERPMGAGQPLGDWIVLVDVSPAGKALNAYMRERSGNQSIDDQAIRYARAGRYRPALVDGIPVSGRYEIRSRARVRPAGP